MSKTKIAQEVHITLAESSVRKQNIVITGLPESADVGLTDELQAFLALCEENFSVKPVLSHLGCRQLGKASEQYKSRKLLVHLRSDEVARDVLAETKKVLKSDNAAVAVYINPDCSPAEATLAYERRQQKRTARQRSSSFSCKHVTMSLKVTDFKRLKKSEILELLEKSPLSSK